MEIATVDQVARIRELNDRFRTSFVGGVILLTRGVADLSDNVRAEVLSRVRSFNRFNEDNDPWKEHDFGSFQIGQQTFFFKISYYDRAAFEQGEDDGSSDPADPQVTTRVLTLMLSEEY